MPKVRLNEKSIRRAAPPSGQVELWDDITPGFGLRVAAGGARTYFVMKRVGGKLIRRTIGRAPPPEIPNGAKLPDGMYWPADARNVARIRLAEMAGGVDPGLVRVSAAKSEPPSQDPDSFKAVAEAYLADKLRGGGFSLASRPELERKLKVDLVAWHDRSITDIRRRDINELIREKAQDSPIAANRLLSFVKRIFRWAVEVDRIDADPAAAVPKPAEEGARTRYLEPDEIRVFWRACDKLGDPAGRLFKLALVTAQRRGEVAGLRRSELGSLEYKVTDPAKDRQVTRRGEAWLLPATRTKRKVEHTVPLSPLALELINEAPKLYLPTEGGGEGRLVDHVLASGARGDQPVTGWSRFKDRLDELVGREIAREQDEEYDPTKHSLPDWNIHDLRATALTLMEKELGIPRPVTSRIANHSEGDGRSMTARYVRHTWDGEAAEALNRWAELLGRIVGLNVVTLPAQEA